MAHPGPGATVVRRGVTVALGVARARDRQPPGSLDHRAGSCPRPAGGARHRPGPFRRGSALRRHADPGEVRAARARGGRGGLRGARDRLLDPGEARVAAAARSALHRREARLLDRVGRPPVDRPPAAGCGRSRPRCLLLDRRHARARAERCSTDRHLAYQRRVGSLALFEVRRVGWADRIRLLSELPWWVRNVFVKVLLRLRLRWAARAAGHDSPYDPY